MPDVSVKDEPDQGDSEIAPCNGASDENHMEDESKESLDGGASSETQKGDSDKEAKPSDNSDEASKEYTKGDLLWLRIKGYPWWPCVVIQLSDVPRHVRKVRIFGSHGRVADTEHKPHVLTESGICWQAN